DLRANPGLYMTQKRGFLRIKQKERATEGASYFLWDIILSAMCRPCTLLAAVVLTAAAPWSHTQATAAEMSESARTYLTSVLDIREKSALNPDSNDWKRVRTETFAMAGNAQTTTDTYVAIAHAIGELKERHSFLMLPDTLDKDRKQTIQAQMRTELIKTRGTP